MGERNSKDSDQPERGSSPAAGLDRSQGALVPRCRFLVLARIGNFAMLRRHLGRASADRLAERTAGVVVDLLPDARVATVARDGIEIAFEGAAPDALRGALDGLVEAFADPIAIDGEPLRIEMLFGAALTETLDGDDIRLVEEAEHALRQADGDLRSVVREADAALRSVDRIAFAQDLARAVEQDELFLQYQPKMHVRREEIASVEALVRWRHPERGLILPGDFIPLAEETRAIDALTLWVIRRALVDQAALAARGYPLRVFVNIAGVLLADRRFVERACALMGDRTDRIGFEVTETSVIRDPESAIANLHRFAELGVEIAIDDYGAGLSSLAYLKRLPARELKIDKLFVTQLTSSNRDPLIVRSTIDLAHALEMEVVAEGVETQAALALLSVMGCDMIQGFFICRPIGLPALIEFLGEGRYVEAVQESRATFNRLAASWKRA